MDTSLDTVDGSRSRAAATGGAFGRSQRSADLAALPHPATVGLGLTPWGIALPHPGLWLHWFLPTSWAVGTSRGVLDGRVGSSRVGVR